MATGAPRRSSLSRSNSHEGDRRSPEFYDRPNQSLSCGELERCPSLGDASGSKWKRGIFPASIVSGGREPEGAAVHGGCGRRGCGRGDPRSFSWADLAAMIRLNSSIVRAPDEGGRSSRSDEGGLRGETRDIDECDCSISSRDLEFDNDLRRNRPGASVPTVDAGGRSGEPIGDQDLRITLRDDDRGEGERATFRTSNKGRRSLPKQVGMDLSDGDEDGDSAPSDDSRDRGLRRNRRLVSMLMGDGGSVGRSDEEDDDSISSEDPKFDNTVRRAARNPPQPALSSPPNWDPDGNERLEEGGSNNQESGVDSRTNRGLKIDDARPRAHRRASLPNIGTSADIMADYISLKLAVADLRSELQVAQDRANKHAGLTKTLRGSNDALQGRVDALEEENCLLRSLLAATRERREPPRGGTEGGRRTAPRSESAPRHRSWKNPELDWGPLSGSDRTPALEPRGRKGAKERAVGAAIVQVSKAAASNSYGPKRRASWWNAMHGPPLLRSNHWRGSICSTPADAKDASDQASNKGAEIATRNTPPDDGPSSLPRRKWRRSSSCQSLLEKATSTTDASSSKLDRSLPRSRSLVSVGQPGPDGRGADEGGRHEAAPRPPASSGDGRRGTRRRRPRRRVAGAGADEGGGGVDAGVPRCVAVPDGMDPVDADDASDVSNVSSTCLTGIRERGQVVVGNGPRPSLAVMPWKIVMRKMSV